MGAFISVLNTSTINIAIPFLMTSFQSTIHTMQWTLTGFMLATGLSAPLTGFLAQRFGLRSLYVSLLVGLAVSSVLCALAWNPISLILFRLLQGVFCGLIMPATMTIIYQTIHPDRHALALSIWSMAAWMGPALGPTIAGFILQYLTWHWLFLINVPLALLSIVLILRLMPKQSSSSKVPLDVSGVVLVLYCSFALLLVFSEVRDWGWLDWKTILLLTTGGLTLIMFIFTELRVSNPLLNLRVFQHRRFTLSIILSCVISASLFAGVYMVPFFMQTVQGVSPLKTGLVLLPASAVMVLVMPLVGTLYRRIGVFRFALLGLSMIILSQWKLSSLTLDSSAEYIMFWMMARNIGIALASVPITNAGMEEIPKPLYGHASAVNNWSRQVISSLAIGLFTTLFAWRQTVYTEGLATSVTGGLPGEGELIAMVEGVNDVFLVSGILVLLSFPLIFGLRSKKPVGQISEDG